jgi:hypothetical protein
MTEHRYPCLDISIPRVDLSKDDLRAAFLVSAIWKPENLVDGKILNIGFMDGTQEQQDFVQYIVDKHLQPLVSPTIQFRWGAPLDVSQIRISFRLRGQAWSMIGNEALSVPANKPTMNLGWLDDDKDYDAIQYKGTGQVVLHEFGHAMGMIHEHQNPSDNPIVWNEDVVYRDLQRTNGWSRDQVDANMFAKYGSWERCHNATNEYDKMRYCKDQLVNGSDYDVTSIMHYWYPMTWIKSGPTKIPVNTDYSALDKQWLKKYYGGGLMEKFTLNNDNQTYYIILFVLLAVLVLVTYYTRLRKQKK